MNVIRKYFKVLNEYEEQDDEFGDIVATLKIEVPKGCEDSISLKDTFQQIQKDWKVGELLDK